MDKEMAQFQEDLLASVQQMKAGQAVRITEASLSPVTAARHAVGLSQVQFAGLMGVSVTFNPPEEDFEKITPVA